MKISDFLSPANVAVDVRATDKRKLLRELAGRAASPLDLSADHIASELLKREDLGSTGTGGGIALPHARIETVGKPLGIFVRLKKPIDFDAIDGRPVDLVFALLLPANAAKDQLGALACVARSLRDSEILARLRCAKNASEFYSAIVE